MSTFFHSSSCSWAPWKRDTINIIHLNSGKSSNACNMLLFLFPPLLSVFWFVCRRVPWRLRSISVTSWNQVYRHRTDSKCSSCGFLSALIRTNRQKKKKNVWSHSAKAAWGCVDRCLSGLFDISVHFLLLMCALKRDLGVAVLAPRLWSLTASSLTACTQLQIQEQTPSTGIVGEKLRRDDPVSAMMN